MHIEVVRSGGVAGLVRHGRIDTDEVGDEQSLLEWRNLIDAARPMLDRLQDESPESRVRDGFIWTVSVGDTTCELGDSSITGPLRDLAQRTLREGRS